MERVGEVLPDAVTLINPVAIVPHIVQTDGNPKHLVVQRLLHLPDPLPAVPLRGGDNGAILGRQEKHIQSLQNASIPIH